MTVYHGDAGDVDELVKWLRDYSDAPPPPTAKTDEQLDPELVGVVVKDMSEKMGKAADCIEAQRDEISKLRRLDPNLSDYDAGYAAAVDDGKQPRYPAERVVEVARKFVQDGYTGAPALAAAPVAYDEGPKK